MENKSDLNLTFLRRDGVFAGVCAGLANDFKIDLVLLRVLWIMMACLGFGFLFYIVLWLALPKTSDPTLGKRNRILGVCNQIANRWGQPVGLVRLLALSFLLCTGGSVGLGYLLAYLVLGKESVAATK